ncbi:cytoskeleton protein RodZ [Thermotomaculum hydrothermale]|uniref:Cytoskeleton protein RodZ n=1 Tax=Thermotomaculum hydrothermale TaxID=981385 RepID=A0A7R6SXT8_9BACT|nr:helix-turn-helix domain-containing protein [Thermotomaculum hydrothermale]BBB31846.1 cytoskeleton protein RodZ [Thermotomaculum hydrothermale]
MKQIANFLKNFREKKGLLKEDIIAKTTLTKTVINLIEAGEFEKIGAEFYIRSFLKQYCSVIGLTDNETDEIIQKVVNAISKNKVKVNTKEEKKSNKLIVFILLVIFALIVFFVFFRGKKPKLKNIQQTKIVTKTENNSVSETLKKGFKESVNSSNESHSKELKVETPVEKKKNENPKSEANIKEPIANKPVEEKSSKTDIRETKNVKTEAIKNKVNIKFVASCMCWVNISFKGKVVRDFILKENEVYSIDVPKNSTLTVGNASCLKLYFNGRIVELGDEKVVRNILVE